MSKQYVINEVICSWWQPNHNSVRSHGTRYFSRMKSRQIIFVTEHLVHEVSHGCRGRQVISVEKKNTRTYIRKLLLVQMLYEAVRSVFQCFIPCAAFRFVRAAAMPVSDWVALGARPLLAHEPAKWTPSPAMFQWSLIILCDDRIDMNLRAQLLIEWFICRHSWFMYQYVTQMCIKADTCFVLWVIGNLRAFTC